jgi:hypothetical protein
MPFFLAAVSTTNVQITTVSLLPTTSRAHATWRTYIADEARLLWRLWSISSLVATALASNPGLRSGVRLSTHSDRDLSLFGVTLWEQGGGGWRSCSSRSRFLTFSPRSLDTSFMFAHNMAPVRSHSADVSLAMLTNTTHASTGVLFHALYTNATSALLATCTDCSTTYRCVVTASDKFINILQKMRNHSVSINPITVPLFRLPWTQPSVRVKR